MAENPVNVSHVVKGSKLIITVDISKGSCDAAQPSISGKTMKIGSSAGFISFDGPPGWKLSYGINVIGKQV